MSKTVPALRRKWDREKDSYQAQEVGSGVQGFVKDVLECAEIFNLSEGALSTPNDRRNNEFIYEKRTRDRRSVDFVIYINSEIMIPVEVEQYTRIRQGEKQLAQYQSDLDGKYGLLTDGWTWRFYNSNTYRGFTLDDIFSDTGCFLEFWKEYIKPENYYLSQFGQEIGQLPLFEKTELRIEDNRQLFFKDITTLIGSFKNKLRLEGYFNGVDNKEAEKRATEITYAYIIQFILYKTLVDNRFEDFGDDYRSRLESIQDAIKNHGYKEILGVIDGMSYQISESVYRPFTNEQDSIRSKLIRLMHKAKNELSDVSPWLDIIVFIKKYSFQDVHNEILGYVYENYLKELYHDEKRGQYFTDPAVVNFMLEQLGYTAKEIKRRIEDGEPDSLSIVDPACGSGTFLYSATSEIVKSFSTITGETSKQIKEIVSSSVFGLDVEEFPLYLAEMSILMRMLPLILGEKHNNPVVKKIKMFLTRDSIAEFIGSGLEYTESDVGPVAGQLSYFGTVVKLPYPSYVRDEEDLAEMLQSMTSFPRRRFDYVIANPPYIPYNECSKQGMLIFQLLKDGKARLGNIYGVNLHSVAGCVKKHPPKPNLYTFFIALGLALLKDNGRLCYIVPQTLLTAGDLDVLRYHLAKYVTIERIVTFNRNLFIERGLKRTKVIPTSSLIIVVAKNPPDKGHRVEVVNYAAGEDTIGETMRDISGGRRSRTREVSQAELAENYPSWNYLLRDDAFMNFYQDYRANSVDIGLYYDHKRAVPEFSTRFYFDIGYNIDERKTLAGPVGEESHYRLPKLDNANWRINQYRGYWPDIRTQNAPMAIELLRANQGYNLLDSTYKVIWSYMNPTRFYFADTPIIWPRNRICAIGSDNKEELQYLFSILNSSVMHRVLLSQLKSSYEKDLLVSITSIKQYARAPIITDQNRHIKAEVTARTGEMLGLEERKLSGYVDFTGILVQKFEEVLIEGSNLVLVYDGQRRELPIQQQTELVATSIQELSRGQQSDQEKRHMTLHELRDIPIIDRRRQRRLKAYIDDLVFALYFGISLQNLGLKNAAATRNACLSNRYCDYVFEG